MAQHSPISNRTLYVDVDDYTEFYPEVLSKALGYQNIDNIGLLNILFTTAPFPINILYENKGKRNEFSFRFHSK